MKPKPIFSITTLFIAFFLLAACGGGSPPESGPAELTVTGTDDFKFEPAELTVKAGQEVVLTYKNGGAVEHSFNLLKPDAVLEHVLEETEEEHIDEELLVDIHEIEGGASETATFTAPTEPGEYTFACLVPGHAQAGEVGTLKVVP
ncbi:MAG TPA: plastocyanin/azurin family copper-binding protein [Anaerolineales bacterium]|nr:plastocyanin/azurin family copper-binding protein [Anaerolineales bacterium]